jgi:hypothetical protein
VGRYISTALQKTGHPCSWSLEISSYPVEINWISGLNNIADVPSRDIYNITDSNDEDETSKAMLKTDNITPTTQGQVEKSNGVIFSRLTKMCLDHSYDNWAVKLVVNTARFGMNLLRKFNVPKIQLQIIFHQNIEYLSDSYQMCLQISTISSI